MEENSYQILPHRESTGCAGAYHVRAEWDVLRGLDHSSWKRGSVSGAPRPNWRRDPESNRTDRICNPGHNRFAIAPKGTISPAAPGATSRPASGKSYNKKGKPSASLLESSGAGEESRTLDLNLGKVALYQLSYSRKCLLCFLLLFCFCRRLASPCQTVQLTASSLALYAAKQLSRKPRQQFGSVRKPIGRRARGCDDVARRGCCRHRRHVIVGQCSRDTFERDLEHLVDPADRNDLEPVLRVLRNFLQVLGRCPAGSARS